MKKTYFGFFMLLLISLWIHTSPAYACKMTPLGSSTAVMASIIDYVQHQPEHQEQAIFSIQKMSFTDQKYLVKLLDNETQICQALVLQITIQPDCSIEVSLLNKDYACQFEVKYPYKK